MPLDGSPLRRNALRNIVECFQPQAGTERGGAEMQAARLETTRQKADSLSSRAMAGTRTGTGAELFASLTTDVRRRFWMTGTRLSFDIAWLDRKMLGRFFGDPALSPP